MRPRITPEQWPLSSTVLGSTERPSLENSTGFNLEPSKESEHKSFENINNEKKAENDVSAKTEKLEIQEKKEKLDEFTRNEKTLNGGVQDLNDSPDEWHQVKTKRQKKGRVGGSGNSLGGFEGEEIKTATNTTELDFQFDEEIDDASKEKEWYLNIFCKILKYKLFLVLIQSLARI